ncbi:Cobalamin biosynthesis protein CbiG / cobalt-precorrin-3b C17-methyltransferase [Devosia sp. LC5]|uniref:cobalamin biosynthesis protein n=1 Tax=Devosia sp. LC5 TaxID=1502724 RepID=UPI0004E4595D|nr:cobalamin biosynthesis protein [Devosia sp. LC5]KFC65721.1 Cobalamin biosynthesis protein CbiG / cobalt-precorrin-3b C17-methyltransferase [Devosia sp. LC5]
MTIGERRKPARAVPNQQKLVAGIGCGSAASAGEIIALVNACLAESGLHASALLAIASHQRKHDAQQLYAASAHFGVPLRLLSDADLAPATPSPSVLTHVGLPAIAEAVAAAAGPLLLGKRKSAHATCALAACGSDFDPTQFGRAALYPSSSAAMASSTLDTSRAGP